MPVGLLIDFYFFENDTELSLELFQVTFYAPDPVTEALILGV